MTIEAIHAGTKCPRCGERRPLTRYDVCVPCAALCGWDPPCEACHVEDRGGAADLPHVATCDGNRVKADTARVQRIIGLETNVRLAVRELTAEVQMEAYERGVKQGRWDALRPLHAAVLVALGANTDRERKATDDGREGDALLNAARVEAFDWVLQRIDEELAK